MGLPDEDIEALNFAGWLHDVGLASPKHQRAQHHPHVSTGGADDSAETSTSLPVAASDFDWLASHPERGVRMVEGITFLQGSAAAILHHHERWDGCGYPDRLRGSDIPLLARIIAVAATASAVAVQQEYDVERTVATLREQAGRQLDPECVEVLAGATGLLAPDPHAPASATAHELDHDLPSVSDLMVQAAETGMREGHR